MHLTYIDIIFIDYHSSRGYTLFLGIHIFYFPETHTNILHYGKKNIIPQRHIQAYCIMVKKTSFYLCTQ